LRSIIGYEEDRRLRFGEAVEWKFLFEIFGVDQQFLLVIKSANGEKEG
jgi:hypothetical protein